MPAIANTVGGVVVIRVNNGKKDHAIWSLMRRGWLSDVASSTPEHLVQRIRRGLRHIQYRSELKDGCLAETGLTIRPA